MMRLCTLLLASICLSCGAGVRVCGEADRVPIKEGLCLSGEICVEVPAEGGDPQVGIDVQALGVCEAGDTQGD